jgi:predicted Zn-dependent protease
VIDEWDRNLQMLELIEVHQGADITVLFSESDKKNEDSPIRVAKTSSTFGGDGLVERVLLVIFTDIVMSDSQMLKQLIQHEFGHALGLGHANFRGDLMSSNVFYQAKNISACDITGVQRLVNQSINNDNPEPSTNETFKDTIFRDMVIC